MTKEIAVDKSKKKSKKVVRIKETKHRKPSMNVTKKFKGVSKKKTKKETKKETVKINNIKSQISSLNNTSQTFYFNENTYFSKVPDLMNKINKEYKNTKELLEYQKFIKNTKDKNIEEIENKWAEDFLQPIIDFFGDQRFINILFKVLKNDKHIYNEDYKKSKDCLSDEDDDSVYKGLVVKHKCFVYEKRQLYFAKLGHWYANDGKTNKWIDPYIGIQLGGTNQFCQTYAQILMSRDTKEFELKQSKNTNEVDVYYDNTKTALEWQRKQLDIFKNGVDKVLDINNYPEELDYITYNDIIELLESFIDIYPKHRVLMQMPYACINVVTIPPKNIM
jgi:hypothetical protein